MTTGEQYAAAIAAQVKAERAASGLTVAEITRQTGVSSTAYHRYVSGERDIPMGALFELCNAFGLSLAQLIARAEERIINDAGQADAS